MTKTEALIYAIESDLADVHYGRMGQRKGELFLQLRQERVKVPPDQERIDELRMAMTQVERDKSDLSITEREVLDPLREQLRREQASSAR